MPFRSLPLLLLPITPTMASMKFNASKVVTVAMDKDNSVVEVVTVVAIEAVVDSVARVVVVDAVVEEVLAAIVEQSARTNKPPLNSLNIFFSVSRRSFLIVDTGLECSDIHASPSSVLLHHWRIGSCILS